jgi:hypothetical protein
MRQILGKCLLWNLDAVHRDPDPGHSDILAQTDVMPLDEMAVSLSDHHHRSYPSFLRSRFVFDVVVTPKHGFILVVMPLLFSKFSISLRAINSETPGDRLEFSVVGNNRTL